MMKQLKYLPLILYIAGLACLPLAGAYAQETGGDNEAETEAVSASETESDTETESEKEPEKEKAVDVKSESAPEQKPKKSARREAIEHYNKGVELHKQGQFNRAIAEYKEAIQANPKLEQAYSNLGLLYTAQKNWTKAMESFEKALEIKPDRTTSLNGLGSVLFAMKKPEEALEKWKRVVELNPKFESAYYNMGYVYEKDDKYLKALEVYSKALSVNPRMADSYYRMGVLLNKNEHPAQALVMLNKAISLEPAGDFVREARKQIASINKDFKKEEDQPAGEDDRKRAISDSGNVEKSGTQEKGDGKGKTALIRSFFKLKKENEDKSKDMNMFIQPPKELSDLQSKPKE